MMAGLLAGLGATWGADGAYGQASPAPTWDWAIAGNGPDVTWARGLAPAGDGQFFATGDFTDLLDFGGERLVSAGGQDSFIARLGATGEPLWLIGFGGAGDDVMLDADANAAGRLAVSGLTGSATLDWGGTQITTERSPGLDRDVFVGVLDADGQFGWAISFGGSGVDVANEVAVGAAGQVAFNGAFGSDRMTLPDGRTVTRAGGDLDAYVTMFNPDGSLRWFQPLGGVGSDEGRGVDIDPAGHVLFAGQFTDQLTLGGQTFTSAGGDDSLVARFDGQTGALLWARSWGGAGEDQARAIDAAPDGSIYAAGKFTGEVEFGPGVSLTSQAGSTDIFLTRLDADGQTLWARGLGGVRGDEGAEIQVDDLGHVYLAGSYFGPIDVNGEILEGEGRLDPFVARFTPDGDLEWIVVAGGASNEVLLDVALNLDGSLALSGYFEQLTNFSPFTLTGDPAGDDEFFIARLTVVPEPTSALLVLGPALGVLMWRRRHPHRSARSST